MFGTGTSPVDTTFTEWDAGRSRRPVRPGGSLLDAGQPEDAVLEYQETIRLKPDYSAAHRGLGRALEKAGRLAEAETA
jgi:Flp pilus assembly protein TadD